MMLRRFAFAATALVSMTACVGTAIDDEMEGVPLMGTQISNGLLRDVELPSEADINRLPTENQAVLRDFIALNENGANPDPIVPGKPEYSGAMGALVTDHDTGAVLATLTGSIVFTGDFEFGSTTVNGVVDDLSATIVGRGAVETSGTIPVTFARREDDFDGFLQGDIVVDGEEIYIDTTINGYFANPGSVDTLATFSGGARYSEGPDDKVEGVFVASLR